MTYQFEGDATTQSHVLYLLVLPSVLLAAAQPSRPRRSRRKPNRSTFTAMPRIDNKNIKAYAEAGDCRLHATFDTAPYVVGPTIAT